MRDKTSNDIFEKYNAQHINCWEIEPHKCADIRPTSETLLVNKGIGKTKRCFLSQSISNYVLEAFILIFPVVKMITSWRGIM